MNPIRRLSRRIRAHFLRRKLQRAWREDADPVDIIHLELELSHLTQE